jgi:hypothetical protein
MRDPASLAPPAPQAGKDLERTAALQVDQESA